MSSSKRKYGKGQQKQQQKQHHHQHHQPLRGAPGILWTCEVGRERKCLHQGLEILQHYWEEKQEKLLQQVNKTADVVVEEDRQGEGEGAAAAAAPLSKERDKEMLSFEEELAGLKGEGGGSSMSKGRKSRKKKHQVPFHAYETGCRGNVFLLCTLPECQLVLPTTTTTTARTSMTQSESSPSNKQLDQQQPVVKKTDDTSSADEPLRKRQRGNSLSGLQTTSAETKDEAQTPTPSIHTPSTSSSLAEVVWDPVETVRAIVQDLQQHGGETTSAAAAAAKAVVPSSRFILRMIPIQATCFAGREEITQTVEALLQRFLQKNKNNNRSKSTTAGVVTNPTTTTFSVRAKRRHCEHLKRLEIIDLVADQVGITCPGWTVDLKQPDVTVIVEICKTLCGISVLSTATDMVCHNFNLAEIRINHNNKTAVSKKDDEEEEEEEEEDEDKDEETFE